MQALELRAATAGWGDSGAAASPAADLGRSRLQLVDEPLVAEPPWHDKLQAVPAMRSALIPLEDDEGGNWSKPFSLVKADFEPWLSYYAGYCNSRLFLGPVSGEEGRRALDYPVRALLALRKLDPALILEPLVQIEGPVEYFDVSRVPRAKWDGGLTQSLARAAEAMHRNQLRRAGECGLELGNQLHDALLGEGMSNLIRTWEKVHARKPSPHELHLMLTTGRVEPVKTPEPVVPVSQVPVRRQPAPVPAASPFVTPVPVPQASEARMEQQAASSRRPELRPSRPDESTGSYWRYLIHLAGAAGMGALIYLLVQ